MNKNTMHVRICDGVRCWCKTLLYPRGRWSDSLKDMLQSFKEKKVGNPLLQLATTFDKPNNPSI